MEMWQSWFNAPDLKSDEGASPPGVRIPTSPPIKKGHPRGVLFLLCVRNEGFEPQKLGFDCQREADERMPVSIANERLRGEANPYISANKKRAPSWCPFFIVCAK